MLLGGAAPQRCDKVHSFNGGLAAELLESILKPPRKLDAFSNFPKMKFRRRLLAWYDLHRRDLPWRSSRDPYRVWLSEIMLQQTRVAAVIAHYHEFLRRFPKVWKLAAARESSVLAAREHGGNIPASAKALLALPGVGRYTAAAIASIAFGEPVAVVDGNVERVLQRLFAKRVAGEELWQAANDLLDAKRSGDFNQAMMELGAMVCTPRAPGCLTCPVVELCATRGEMAGAAKARQKKREIHYALDCSDGQVFLVQRSRDASLMAGMWELPEIAHPGDRAQPDFIVRHSITVTNYKVHVWRRTAPDLALGKWIPLRRMRKLAMTGLTRKILRRSPSPVV